MDRTDLEPRSGTSTTGRRRWCRGLGWAGFLFFLLKGLLWIAGPALLVAWQKIAS